MKTTNPDIIQKLESPERRKVIDLDKILASLPLEKEHVVVDLGCGTGFFTVALGDKLNNGLVYAADISRDMLAIVEEKIARDSRTNIKTIASTEGKIPLPDQSVDGVLAAFVLHEIENLSGTLEEIKRILRPNGWLAVIEWKKEQTSFGPPEDEKLTPEDIADEAKKVGISSIQAQDISEHHYLQILRG